MHSPTGHTSLIFISILLCFSSACGSSHQDSCNEEDRQKCEDGYAMYCTKTESSSRFGGKGLFWLKNKCDGETPFCISEKHDGRTIAFCSATDSKICDQSDSYTCYKNRIHSCKLKYPTDVFKKCGTTETCVRNDNVRCKPK